MSPTKAAPVRWAELVCAAGLLLVPTAVLACGACDEESIAATYDHGVVEKAAKARDLLVYCQLDGSVERQPLLSATRRVPGIRTDSIRISGAPAALSFAVDPARQTALTAVAAIERGLAPDRHLRILKVVAGAPERSTAMEPVPAGPVRTVSARP